MKGDGVVSLFHQVLLLLLSVISADVFPLDALALLPLVMRRRVFLLLPIVDLHRLERDHPAATEGINMAEVWEELFTERLCQHTEWLTEPHTLQIKITSNNCVFRRFRTYLGGIGAYRDVPTGDVRRLLFTVPLIADLAIAKGRVDMFEKLEGEVCTWHCKDCERYTFFCSSKYIHLFDRPSSGTLSPVYLEAITVLEDIFPLQIDSTLVVGTLAGLMTPPVNVAEPEFRRLLGYIHTLEFNLSGPTYHMHSLEPARTFLEGLLELLLSNPHSVLQNLHLYMVCYSRSRLAKYNNMVINIVSSYFSRSRSSNVTPFLCLKGLKIEAKPLKQALKKFVAIITHQKELESLEICGVSCKPLAYEALFKVVMGCLSTPTLRCLTLENFDVSASTILDIEQDFLVSTACAEQELVLKDLVIHSSGVRRNISYASESAACTKSLSVIGCSATDVGIFSTADIVSGILSHPGVKSVNVSHSLDRVDLYKLTTALEIGTGTLKLLDLTGCDLSSVIVRAGPLFRTIFHLPHLSELELVLKRCCLTAEDLDDLFCEWEKETSCRRKQRKRTRGRSLRKLCVCGNSSPEDKSNLEVMARFLC